MCLPSWSEMNSSPSLSEKGGQGYIPGSSGQVAGTPPPGKTRAGQLAPHDLSLVPVCLDSPTLGQIFDQLKSSVPGIGVDVRCDRHRGAVVSGLDADAALVTGNRQIDRAVRVTRRVGDELGDHQLCMTEGVLTSTRGPQLVLDEPPCFESTSELRCEPCCRH